MSFATDKKALGYIKWEKDTVNQFNKIKAILDQDPTGQSKVGFLYAANEKQSDNIKKGYANGTIPILDGGGQANVINDLNQILNQTGNEKYKARIHILPIATSKIGGPDDAGNQVDNDSINRDLQNVQYHKNQGYTIIGLSRPSSYDNNGNVKVVNHFSNDDQNAEFAIGGNNSPNFVKVKKFGNQTAHQHVQTQLENIQLGRPLTLLATPKKNATQPITPNNNLVIEPAAGVYSPEFKKVIDSYHSVAKETNGEYKKGFAQPTVTDKGARLTFPDEKHAADFLRGFARDNNKGTYIIRNDANEVIATVKNGNIQVCDGETFRNIKENEAIPKTGMANDAYAALSPPKPPTMTTTTDTPQKNDVTNPTVSASKTQPSLGVPNGEVEEDVNLTRNTSGPK